MFYTSIKYLKNNFIVYLIFKKAIQSLMNAFLISTRINLFYISYLISYVFINIIFKTVMKLILSLRDRSHLS